MASMSFRKAVFAHAIATLVLSVTGAALAAETGGISGQVDGRDGKPVAGATVAVREVGRSATTDSAGRYSISDLAPGRYTLVVTPPSGQSIERPVRVAANATTDQNVALVAERSALESIIVYSQRTSEATAREAQKEAPNLIDIATYEQMRKLPDISTAEAVRRIPGISLETDEGEGRYVNIRGLDADLNSTTFGGLRLPPTNNASPFGGYRAVTLDSIPLGLVGAITVTKSNLPSQDAEALGGTIEITPKTAPPGGKAFLQGNLGSGYEPLRRTWITDVAATGGGRFGGGANATSAERPFSIVATVSYYEDKRGFDDVEPAYFNDANHPFLAISNIQQRDYELNRKRHGFGLDLGYEPDANNSYYVRAFDAGYTERYYRQFLNITPDGATVVQGGNLVDTLNGGTALQKALRDERETARDRVFVAGGKNIFDTSTLDYRVGFTDGSWIKDYDFNSAFNYVPPAPGNVTFTYNLSGPGSTPTYVIAGADYTNPRNYVFAGLTNSTAYNFDKEWSAASNFDMPIHLGAFDTESLKIGLSARLRHKQQTSQPYSGYATPNLLLSSIATGPNEIYYASRYQQGPDIPIGVLQTMLGAGTQTTGDLLASEQQYLDAKENVYAGYAEYQMTIGKWGIVAGARVEHTRDTSHAFATGNDKNGNPFVNPSSAQASYTNVFPGVQARYELAPDLIARATYSSTIARPGFNQSNAALTIDLGSGTVTKGNPDLKPAYANSFDVSIEKYLGNGGILSLGLFDKEIKNYIVANTLANQTLPNNGLYPGNTQPFRIFTFSNASSSYVRGIEVNWEQRFTRLPGLWNGLGAGLNYTYVDSRFQIRPGEYSLLPSTSQNTWNATIFYERAGLNLRLAAYSTSHDLFGIGADKTGDVFNATRTSMDFGGSYAVTESWSIYVNAKNLLNTPHAFYQGTVARPIQREFYGQTYQFGVRFDF
jgi:TonB-dependent receptor